MSEPPAPHPSPGHPSPGPRHAAAAPSPDAGHPRRWFLAGAGAVVVAAGGGVGVALLQHDPVAPPRPAPPELAAGIVAERLLLADLDATTGGTPAVRRLLTRARADHAAHLQALVALAAGYDASRTAPGPRGAARSVAQLRGAEQAASRRAAARAAALDGTSAQLATVLASIAACEATHAALLA